MMLFSAVNQKNFDISFFLFGVVLISIAYVGVTRKVKSKASPIGSWGKYIFAAYAASFAIWIMLSIIILPFYGDVGFMAIGNSWFAPSLLVFALGLVPVTKRYMQRKKH